MSSTSSVQRQKKKKVSKPATQIPLRSKQAKKKKKTRLTRDYEEKEKEVQQLLGDFNLNVGSFDSKENDFDTQSIEFFCSERGIHTAKMQSTLKQMSADFETISTEQSDISDNSNIGLEDEKLAIKSENQNQSEGQIQTLTAASFITVESDDLLKSFPTKTNFEFEENLFYKPKSSLQRNMRLETGPELLDLPFNTIRMLNRYYEESKSRDEKLSKTIIHALQKSTEINKLLRIDSSLLYRSYCLHEFHQIFCKAMPTPTEIPMRQFFKIFLKELRFTQHPQLCEEHSLANELEDMYENYAERQQKRLDVELEKNLQMERSIVNALMKRISEKDNNFPPSEEQVNVQVLQEHLFKVKDLRVRLYEEKAYNKKLLKKILDKWLQLKKLRLSQEFQCTRFKLRIKVQELSHQMISKARIEWANRFQTDLSELYREELEIYYSAKRLWKQAENTNNNNNDSNYIKPKKPNLSHLSAELQKMYSESFYMPEESKIDIQRSRVSDEEFYENTKKMIDNGSHQQQQQQRKLKSYFLKIYFDREFVAESRKYRLEPDLSLGLNEAFGIFLEHRLPKEIYIVLYEKSRIAAPRKIAKIIVPLTQFLTSQSTSNGDSSIFSIEFSSKKEPICGKLYLGLKCRKDMLSNEHALNVPNNATTKVLRNSDDDDDDDEDDEPESKNELCLRTCTFEESLLQFCSLDELKFNARFKLLRSRYLKNDERTRDLCLVPTLENELEFDCESDDDTVIETGNWMDPIDLHKHRGKKYLKNLYEAIRNQCSRLDKVIESTENLLIGDETVSWSLLFSSIATIFRPKSFLDQARNDLIINKHTPSLQWDGKQNFNIIFNVVRACGIPVRAWHEPKDNNPERQRNNASSNMFITPNLKYSNVRPFIVLSYKDKLCRTTTAEGSNPTWNEQLVLQLSGSLTELRDDLKIAIFDEIIESHVNDDDMNTVHMYQRFQMNYLGEYRIPINTILQRQKMEDNIEFNVPTVLLGYKRSTLDNISTGFDTTNIVVEFKESVQLFFYLNIEPKFDLPRLNTKTFECSELREVRQHLHEWSMIVRELQPLRFVEPLVCTEDGKRVCITRLLEPIPLPFEASENLMDSVCRYASLLNIIKCYDPCIGYRGIWLNNQILLDTTWGSPKDFGVLLCNFLLSLGLKCWLILGHSNTYGEATFVLYKNEEENNLNLLEPCSGKRYFITDVLNPLCSINYVIGQDNIYCNIQAETRVMMMNFNFNDSSCWLPAFNKKNPAPLGGVQNLNYSFHNALSTNELAKIIERKIVKKINTWRSMRKTVWNRAFQSRLYNVLLELESKITFKDSSTVDLSLSYADEIAAEYRSYKLYGFTLNFSYTNLSAISDRIRTTGIHLNSDKNVEFSVAVNVHKYANNVLSVWIFIISIVPGHER